MDLLELQDILRLPHTRVACLRSRGVLDVLPLTIFCKSSKEASVVRVKDFSIKFRIISTNDGQLFGKCYGAFTTLVLGVGRLLGSTAA